MVKTDDDDATCLVFSGLLNKRKTEKWHSLLKQPPTSKPYLLSTKIELNAMPEKLRDLSRVPAGSRYQCGDYKIAVVHKINGELPLHISSLAHVSIYMYM